MTPTTAEPIFLCAVLKAGCHIILAKVAEIQAKIPAGVGIMLRHNSLYTNLHQFRFQRPLLQGMRRRVFLTSVLVSRVEKKLQKSLMVLRIAGVKHDTFKPGSIDGIQQVV
jgi:enoyl reductase-like protein